MFEAIKSQKQNAELPLNAREQDSPTEPKFNYQEGFNPLFYYQNLPHFYPKGTQKGTVKIYL